MKTITVENLQNVEFKLRDGLNGYLNNKISLRKEIREF